MNQAEMDHKLETMKEEILAGMSIFTNRILTAIDPLLRELETRQQEREMQAAQMKQATERLDGHDQRIERLEQTVADQS